MQENRFEKDVQDQMDELRLRPSEEVWQKVELELRKKKRRRVIFFFFLLAGLSLLGYSGYTFFAQTSTDESRTVHAIENKIQSTDTKKTTRESANTSSTTTEQKPDASVTSKNIIPSTPLDINKPSSPDAGLTRLQTRTQSRVAKKSNTHLKSAVDNDKPTEETKEVEIPSVNNNQSVPAVAPVAGNEQQHDISKADSLSSPEEKTIAHNETMTDSLKHTAEPVTASVVKAPKSKYPQIRWGVEFSYGFSTRNRSAGPRFGVDANKSLMNAYNSAPGSVTAPPATPPLPYVYTPLLPVKSGTAFQLGIIGQLQLSQKSSITAGLEYAYRSNHITTGQQKDTNILIENANAQYVRVDAIYRGTVLQNRVDKYHFLQVPISYEVQLNKSKKLPISWRAGVSVGYLFGSDALVYDTSFGGFYYKDKSVINKWHFGINTGLAFHFGKPGGWQWNVGPEISLSMSKLLGNAFDSRQYLQYGGITGRLFLPKKKK